MSMFKIKGFIGSFKTSFFVGLLFLAFFGPVALFMWSGFAIPFHYWSMRRGRRFVRAFNYMLFTFNGDDPSTANAKAASIGFNEASDRVKLALGYADKYFDGDRLALIASAYSLGFRG